MIGRSWFCVMSALAFFAVMSTEASTVDFDLPAWESNGGTASLLGGLFPVEGGSVVVDRNESSILDKSPSEKRLAEFVLLEKESIEPVDAMLHPEILDDLPPLDDALLKQYFEGKPVEFLIDPQGLITEQKANDILRFLEYHFEESRFSIYPIVLGHEQSIPESIDLHHLHEEWFGEKPTVLVVYHLLNLDSLQLIYNQSVTDKVSAASLEKIRENIIREAELADNSADQLEKIAIEMSIQAFVLEKLMDGKPVEPPVHSDFELTSLEISTAPVPVQIEMDPVQIEMDPVEIESHEVISQPADVISLSGILKEPVRVIANPDVVKWIVAGSSAILFFALIFFLKNLISSRRNTASKPILFPSYTRRERLGGEFTGGAFVGISFELGRSDGRLD